jgi:hypothetical protein
MIGDTTVTLTAALPLPLVAVAVTVHEVLGYKGALKSPVDEIDPQVAVHVDATLALNWTVTSSCTFNEAGETVTAEPAVHARIKSATVNVRSGVTLIFSILETGTYSLRCEMCDWQLISYRHVEKWAQSAAHIGKCVVYPKS